MSNLLTVIKNDLEKIFQEDEANSLSIDVTIINTDSTIKGMFDSPYLAIDMLGQEIGSEDSRLYIQTDDVSPNFIEVNSKLQFTNPISLLPETYWVKEIHSDGMGLTTLIISRDTD